MILINVLLDLLFFSFAKHCLIIHGSKQSQCELVDLLAKCVKIVTDKAIIVSAPE